MAIKDREFCNLVACAYDIPVIKMPYLMYLFQEAGMQLGYRYSVRFNTIKSHGLVSSLGDLVAGGYVTSKYKVTDSGSQRLSKFLITAEKDDMMNKVLYYVDIFDISQLYLLCVSDIIIQGELQSGDYNSLIRNKEEVIGSIKDLCVGFTYDDFNTCLKIMREIRGRESIKFD